MEEILLYADEHVACCRYSKLNNRLQDDGQAIEPVSLKAGARKERIVTDTELLFVSDGVCQLSVDGETNVNIEKGYAILMPVGQKYAIHMEVDTDLVIFKLPTNIELCETYSMKQLYEEKSKSGNKRDFSLLKINDRIRAFTENVTTNIRDGFKCTKFLNMKVTELMFLLRAYYSNEELADFFYPILNKDMEFANMILENWANVKNKADLAELSNLSPSRFGVKFKEVFGISPYKWLINQRSERIYYDLVSTNHSLKQISEEFKFRSVQHFNDFCKKQFGKTPGQIRSGVGSGKPKLESGDD